MPKPESGIEPIVPLVAAETWNELFAVAEDLQRLAPWKWMHDSQVVGLCHPKTNEVLLGSILGRRRQVFAVLIYRNDAGRRWLLETILNDGVGEDDNSGFDQDLVKVEFVLKRDLAKEDKAVLAAAGFSPRSKQGCVWPQFRSMTPGGYPWHVTQSEAELLLWTIPRVMAAARLTQEKPDWWDSHCEGEIAFLPLSFDPGKDELTPEQIDWQPMLPPPPASVKQFVSMDEKAMRELSRLEKAKGFELEVDLCYSSIIVIGDVDRPRFPKLAMAVDRKSGFVGGFHLSETGDPEGAVALGKVVHSSMIKLGVRPEVILVQRRRVAEMLKKMAAELDIRVEFDTTLDALNFAKESMEEYFRDRRPGNGR